MTHLLCSGIPVFLKHNKDSLLSVDLHIVFVTVCVFLSQLGQE